MSSWRLPILTIKYLISWKFLQFLFNYNKISAYNVLSPPVKHHVFICRWIQIKNYQQINFQRKINLLNNHKLTSIHLHHSYLCIHTHTRTSKISHVVIWLLTWIHWALQPVLQEKSAAQRGEPMKMLHENTLILVKIQIQHFYVHLTHTYTHLHAYIYKNKQTKKQTNHFPIFFYLIFKIVVYLKYILSFHALRTFFLVLWIFWFIYLMISCYHFVMLVSV